RVPNRQRGNSRRPIHAKCCVVAHRVTGLEIPDLHDWRPQIDDILRLNRGATSATDTVKKDSRTHEVPRTSALPRDRSAVCRVQQTRPRWKCRYRFAESCFLDFQCPVIELGGMKVRERALGWQQFGEMPDSVHLPPW